MSKDYAKRFNPNPEKSKSPRLLKWIVVILVLLVLVIGFRFWQLQTHRTVLLVPEKSAHKVLHSVDMQQPTQETSEQTQTPKVHFEFYTMLSQNKVVPEHKEPISVLKQETVAPPKESIATIEAITHSSLGSKKTTEVIIPKVPEKPVLTEKYVLQLGVFSNPITAGASKHQMGSLGVPIFVVQDKTNGKVIYRVQAGPFATKEAAIQLQAKLAKSKVQSIVRLQA
jgi:cell division protein FtsN